jgi:hypothetical protein
MLVPFETLRVSFFLFHSVLFHSTLFSFLVFILRMARDLAREADHAQRPRERDDPEA